MRYTEEERVLIAKKAIKERNVTKVSAEYGLNKSTVYRYIEKLSDNKNRKNHLNISLTNKEYDKFIRRANQLGYEKNYNEYIREMLFNKHRIMVNPNKLIDELYLLRAELNKIGSNLNQVANYTNFLLKNNYVEHSHLKEFQEIELNFENKIYELKDTIYQTIDKTL